MASKPTVTMTFAGDESKLTSSFEKVGAASTKMGDDVGKASSRISESSGKLEGAIEKADTIDTRAMGFRDTITGVSDTLKGLNDSSLSTEERLLTLGMGIGDLASGFANYLLPALGNAAAFMKGGLATAMNFIAAHPLIITIGLLTAAIVFLVTRTEWFRDVATNVWNWIAGLVKNVTNATVGWVIDRWNDVTGWFERLPENIGKAFTAVGRFIGDAFKGALNVAIDILNWFVDRANDLIYGINIVNPFDDIPYIGHIARLHSGGVVPGSPGMEVPMMLQAGEEVTSTAGRRTGDRGVTVNWGGDVDGAFATAFMNMVRLGQITITEDMIS
jgi:phage-related protein